MSNVNPAVYASAELQPAELSLLKRMPLKQTTGAHLLAWPAASIPHQHKQQQ
jgi:hypothetical protein